MTFKPNLMKIFILRQNHKPEQQVGHFGGTKRRNYGKRLVKNETINVWLHRLSDDQGGT